MTQIDLVIDPEFNSLMPQLTDEEYYQLVGNMSKPFGLVKRTVTW